MIDIVPRLCGTYEELAMEAHPAEVAGHEVVVAHPATVLDRLDLHRPKDEGRRREVEKLRDAVRAGRVPEPDLSALV